MTGSDKSDYASAMLALRCARVFDGEGFTDGPATVLLDDGVVVAVEDGHPDVAAGCRVIDHSTHTALPGLIDTHVHLVCDSGPGALDRAAAAGDLDEAIGRSLAAQLAAGVTAVRDLGDRDFAVVDRRRSSAGRAEPGVVAAGPPLTVPGGHCHFLVGVVDGPDAIVAGVREHAERGADLIKVMASGGMSTPGTATVATQFGDDELRLIVDEAHARGLPVTAHAHWLAAIDQAVRAGVDGIEHCSGLTPTGVDLPDALVGALADRQMAVSGVIPPAPAEFLQYAPPAVREMLASSGRSPEQVRGWRAGMVRRLWDAGVPVVTGLDAGLNPWLAHGALARSIDLFADAGLAPAQVLAAATSVAARVCGLGRKGRLAAGYDADVLLVDADPLRDIGSAVRRVGQVYLGGISVSGGAPADRDDLGVRPGPHSRPSLAP